MSLSEPGVGVLETHVEWSDIQKHLHEAFGKDAVMGPEKKIQDITECNGFGSKMCVLEPDWVNKSNSFPQKLIVKIICLLNNDKKRKEIEEDGGVKPLVSNKSDHDNHFSMCHNHEVAAYRFLNSLNDTDLDIVKVYSMEEIPQEGISKGFFIMEKVENLASIHLDTVFSDNDLHKILRSIAKIHSTGSKLTENQRKSMGKGVMSEIFVPMFKKQFIDGMVTMCRGYFDETKSSKMDTVEEMVRKLMDIEALKDLDNTCNLSGMEKVFCHGDLWTTNILMTQNADGSYNIKSLIDYQASHYGCGVHDLTRLFSSSMTTEQLRNWRDFLKVYHGYLVEFTDKPATYEQIEKAFIRLFPVMGYILITTIVVLTNMVSNTREDKEKSRQFLHDKASGLLDIVVELMKINN